MAAMPPVLAATAPAPESLRSVRRLMRAMMFPPGHFQDAFFLSGKACGCDARVRTGNQVPRIQDTRAAWLGRVWINRTRSVTVRQPNPGRGTWLIRVCAY